MNFVIHEEYIGSPNTAESPRLVVTFSKSIDEVPGPFEAWADQNDLVILTERFDEIDTGRHLYVEVQEEDEYERV